MPEDWSNWERRLTVLERDFGHLLSSQKVWMDNDERRKREDREINDQRHEENSQMLKELKGWKDKLSGVWWVIGLGFTAIGWVVRPVIEHIWK